MYPFMTGRSFLGQEVRPTPHTRISQGTFSLGAGNTTQRPANSYWHTGVPQVGDRGTDDLGSNVSAVWVAAHIIDVFIDTTQPLELGLQIALINQAGGTLDGPDDFLVIACPGGATTYQPGIRVPGANVRIQLRNNGGSTATGWHSFVIRSL